MNMNNACRYVTLMIEKTKTKLFCVIDITEAEKQCTEQETVLLFYSHHFSTRRTLFDK